MRHIEEIVEQIESLQRSDLDTWINEELISPQGDVGSMVFSESECARIRLISTLRYELEIEEGTVPVVMSLIDQLYQTRQQLLKLSAAVAAQDKAVQATILDAIDPGDKVDDGEGR